VLILSLVLVAAAGSLLPFSPIEPVLLALPFLAPREWLVPLALLAAAVHMAAKLVLFHGGDRVRRLLPPARQSALLHARARLERSPTLQSLTLFVSACAGFPPFYAITVMAGALGIRVSAFFWLGLAGRGIRFVALVLLPQLFT
jgi:membrane protein YqaA with SNARE-associated domain